MHIENLLRFPEVRSAIIEHYRKGVARARENYHQHAADEDTVTGGLGERLAGRGTVRLPTGEDIIWVTSYTRFRSAGPGAAEKRLGGDGVFEIHLFDPAGSESRKSLVFQAKNQAARIDRRLTSQARKIAPLPGGGIVINYDPEVYRAVDAAVVVIGDRESLADGYPLDVALEEFVLCKRGSTAYFYDPLTESINILSPNGNVTLQTLPLSHRIRTTITYFISRQIAL